MSGALPDNPEVAHGPAERRPPPSREREDWYEDVWGDYGYAKPPRPAEAVASSDEETTDDE